MSFLSSRPILKRCVIAGLSAAVVLIAACKVTLPNTPIGPVTIEPTTPGPGTTIPNPTAPHDVYPHPSQPGREIWVYDLDGDGVPDIAYDPVTKQWYYLTPVSQSFAQLAPTCPANIITLADGSQYTLARGSENRTDCPCSGTLPNWGGLTAAQWISGNGLNQNAGTQFSANLISRAYIDTDVSCVDISLDWSSAFAVLSPVDYNLCYQLFALPSNIGGPSGLQFRVTGTYADVGGWLLDMGVEQVQYAQGGVNYLIVTNESTRTAYYFVNGVLTQTVSLN